MCVGNMARKIRQQDSPRREFFFAEAADIQGALQCIVDDPHASQFNRGRIIFRQGRRSEFVHFSMTFGTLKNFPSVSGAFCIATSCVKPGTTTSGRVAYVNRSLPCFCSGANLLAISASGSTLVVSSPLSASM